MVLIREEVYTGLYVCMDGRCMKKVVCASTFDIREVIECDHAAIRSSRLMEENKNREYRKMRRIHGVNDEKTQMAKIK